MKTSYMVIQSTEILDKAKEITQPRMLSNGNGASVTAYAIDKNTFSAPFGIFYVRTEI